MEISNIPIKPHHQRAIENLVAAYQDDDRFLAIVIGGSVAKGCAREDSDIDFMVVATDEEHHRRKQLQDLFINRTDLCDYPGGFVDGKIINLDYLQKVAKSGNEPSRAAFDGAFVVYNRIDGLDKLIKEISSYPEAGREERMRSFYSMAFIQHWLMGEADRHDNLYTKTRAATQLALFAGRLILAENRVLFPYHKWFIHYLSNCPHQPVEFIDQIQALLRNPGMDQAEALFQNVKSYKDWGVTDHQAYMWFLEEVELSWMDGNAPMEDW